MKTKIPTYEELKINQSVNKKDFNKLCYNRVLENCIEKIANWMMKFEDDDGTYRVCINMFEGIISTRYTAPDGETSYERYNASQWAQRFKWDEEHQVKRTCESGYGGTLYLDDNNPIGIGLGIIVDELACKEQFDFDTFSEFASRDYMKPADWYSTLIEDIEKEFVKSGWKLVSHKFKFDDNSRLDENQWEEVEVTQQKLQLPSNCIF